MQTWA